MLDKIDLHNGCPYKTGEGIFYYVADVKDNLYQLRTEVIAVLDSMKKD